MDTACVLLVDGLIASQVSHKYYNILVRAVSFNKLIVIKHSQNISPPKESFFLPDLPGEDTSAALLHISRDRNHFLN